MNCFFVHSRTPNTWTPPPRNSASSLAQTRSRLLDAYIRCFQLWVFGEKSKLQGMLQEIGDVLVGQPQRAGMLEIQLPTCLCFECCSFWVRFIHGSLAHAGEASGWLNKNTSKHIGFCYPMAFFSQRWTMRTHFEWYRYALDFKHIRWELDRHDMDLHFFL